MEIVFLILSIDGVSTYQEWIKYMSTKRVGAIPEKNHAMMAVFRPGIVPESRFKKLHKHAISQSLAPTSQPTVRATFSGDIANKGKVR